MKVMDLVRYDHALGQFVLKNTMPTPPLSPFRWKEDLRPSIFMEDVRFRAKIATGTITDDEGLGYKQFGVYTRAKERQPNKHEGALEHATAKATRATDRKTNPNV
jgi:hypothetical protein